MRDHYGGGTNSLHRLKQSLEAFAPGLRGTLLPSNIRKHVSTLEKKGVITSNIVDVNYTVTKTGNKRGMCTFYYCSEPAQLIASMFRRMYLDNTFEKSQKFSSLHDMLVVSVGFDKSDSDFVGVTKTSI